MRRKITYWLFICTILFLGIKLFANVYEELPFTFERLTTDFNGAVCNNNVVMVYGNGSIVLKSYDFGDNWNQICIAHDSFDIKKMISFEGNFYGIMNKEIAFRCDSYGSNWELFNIGQNETLTSISVIEKEIYILKQNEITIYNSNFSEIRNIPLDSEIKYREMLNLKNHLFISTNKGLLLKIDLNENDSINIINFSELNIAQDSTIIYSLKTDNKNLFVTIEKKIYKSEDLGNNWKIASNFSGLYNVYEGNIYLLNTIYYNNTFINFPVLKKVLNPQDLLKISIDTVDRYTTLLIFNGFEFLNENNIVAYGMDKLISVSNDGGITWKIVSNLPVSSHIYTWLNDKICYAISNKQLSGGQVFTTTNKGVTWLPQKLTDTSIFNSFNSVISSSIPGIFYAEENGRIFLVYGNKFQNTKNVLISKDYGNTFESISNNELRLILNSLNGKIQPLIKRGNEYLLIIPSIQDKNFNTKNILLDSNFQILDINTLDSITILTSNFYQQDEKIIAIGYERKGFNGKTFDIERNYVMYSFDYGKNWLIDFEFPLIENLYFEPYFYKHLILIPTYKNIDTSQKFKYIYQLSILNLTDKTYQVNAYTTETTFRGFSVLNDKLYWFMGNDTIFIYEKFEDFPQKCEKYLTKSYIIGITNSDLEYGYGVSRRKETTQKSIITLFKFKTSSEIKVKHEQFVYFYFAPPFPNPAHSQVQITIYWDLNYDFDIKKIEIYNYFGKKVNNDGDVRLELSGDNSGNLIWDCRQAQTGIYFIYPKIGNIRYCIPVVILQ